MTATCWNHPAFTLKAAPPTRSSTTALSLLPLALPIRIIALSLPLIAYVPS